jgi:hypothetical protein
LINQGLTHQLAAALADLDDGGDAPNLLVGRYAITVPGGGIEGAGDAIAIQNSDLPLASQSQALCDASGNNCTSSYNWDTREYDHPHLGDMTDGYLANLEAGMEAANVTGDWSNNPANSVGVDWVMSFPTKYLYEDVVASPVPANGLDNYVMLPDTPSGLPAAKTTALANPWPGPYATLTDGAYDGNAYDPPTVAPFCLQTDVHAWGIEEESGTNQEVVSPSPSASLEFCNELNVLTYDINGQALEPSYLATNDTSGMSRRTVVSFAVSSTNPVLRGWSKLGLMWDNADNDAAPAAVEGIVFTVRDTDQAAINNCSVTELQKNQD